MSFILDALKKSESERQRKAAPGIADVPHARERHGRARWIMAASGLLAVNLLVLLAVLLKPETEPDGGPVAAGMPSATPQTPPATADPPFAELVAEAKRNPPEREAPTTTEPPREGTPVEQPAPQPPGRRAFPTATFQDLRAAGELNLPDLHLDIHVYSEKQAERFVFINMTKYKERTNLKEGPLVREITPDGVVLEQAGTVFLLPRQ